MASLSDYPELAPLLADDTDGVSVQEVSGPTGRLLIVVATAGDCSDQFLFEETSEGLVDLTDRTAELLGLGLRTPFKGAADPATHAKSFAAAQAADGHFQTGSGPGGGSLACVWSLRTILHSALGYWVTQTDGTDVFGSELKQDYGSASTEDGVLPGGIVISPTQVQPGTRKRIVGHVGLLGSGTGDARKIYSNSSRRKVWSQNYDVGSWKAYQLPRGLSVLFYPLPQY